MNHLCKMNYTRTSKVLAVKKQVVQNKNTPSSINSSRVIYSNQRFSMFNNMHLENKGCGSCGKK